MAKIAYPTRTVNSTRIGPITFGRISTNMHVGRTLVPELRGLHVFELTLAEHGRPHGPGDDRCEDAARSRR